MAAIPRGSGLFLTIVPGVSRCSTPDYTLHLVRIALGRDEGRSIGSGHLITDLEYWGAWKMGGTSSPQPIPGMVGGGCKGDNLISRRAAAGAWSPFFNIRLYSDHVVSRRFQGAGRKNARKPSLFRLGYRITALRAVQIPIQTGTAEGDASASRQMSPFRRR